MINYQIITKEIDNYTIIKFDKDNSPVIYAIGTNLSIDKINEYTKELIKMQEQYEKEIKEQLEYEKGEKEELNAYKYIEYGFPYFKDFGINSENYKEMLCLLSDDINDYKDENGKIYKKVTICKIPVKYSMYSHMLPCIKFKEYNYKASCYSKHINYRQPNVYCYMLIGVHNEDELNFLEQSIKSYLNDINYIIPNNYLNNQYYLVNIEDLSNWYINDFYDLYNHYRNGEY